LTSRLHRGEKPPLALANPLYAWGLSSVMPSIKGAKDGDFDLP
jgi:hypothetical protein